MRKRGDVSYEAAKEVNTYAQYEPAGIKKTRECKCRREEKDGDGNGLVNI